MFSLLLCVMVSFVSGIDCYKRRQRLTILVAVGFVDYVVAVALVLQKGFWLCLVCWIRWVVCVFFAGDWYEWCYFFREKIKCKRKELWKKP